MFLLEILENINREGTILHNSDGKHCWRHGVFLSIVSHSFLNWIILKLNLFRKYNLAS